MKTVCFFNQQIKINSNELNEFLNSKEVSFYFDEINLLSAGEYSIKIKIDDDSSPFHKRCVVEQFKVSKIIENDIENDIKEIAEEMILDEDEVEKVTEIYSELKKNFVHSLMIEDKDGIFLSLIIHWLKIKFNVVYLHDVAEVSLCSENKSLTFPDVSKFDNKFFEYMIFTALHPDRVCSTFKTEKGLQTVFNEQYRTSHFALNKKSLNLSYFSILIISFLISTGFFIFSIALIQNEYLSIFALLLLPTPLVIAAIIHSNLSNDFLYNRQQKKIINLLNNKCENDKAYSEQELFDFSVKTGIDLPKEYKNILRKIAPVSNGFINYRDENILKIVQENQKNVIKIIKKNPEMLIDIYPFMKDLSSEQINEYTKSFSFIVIPINEKFGFLCDNFELYIYEFYPFGLLKVKNSFAKILGHKYNGESGFYNYLINFLKKQ